MTLPFQSQVEFRHGEADVNGVRLHYVEAGSGPLVILLHGFPEFWYSWRHQLPALAAAGFHAIAPDLRGYNLSDKPRGVEAYRLEKLMEDVLGLIEHCGASKTMLVGHDWGGVIAWHLAMHYPQAIERLVILNAPHPAAYRRALRSWTQRLKSWYVFLFQLPFLPEQLLRARDFAWLERLLRRQPTNPHAFTSEDVQQYKQALAQPGALTAALNYYRALRQRLPSLSRDTANITAPTLVLWGERDAYLSVGVTQGLNAWVPDLRVVRFPDVSHWIQNDVPEQVNSLLIDFLRGTPGSSSEHANTGLRNETHPEIPTVSR